LIADVYQRKCPEKKGNTFALLQKYAGMERELYVRICQKYGEDPVPEATPPAATVAAAKKVQLLAKLETYHREKAAKAAVKNVGVEGKSAGQKPAKSKKR